MPARFTGPAVEDALQNPLNFRGNIKNYFSFLEVINPRKHFPGGVCVTSDVIVGLIRCK